MIHAMLLAVLCVAFPLCVNEKFDVFFIFCVSKSFILLPMTNLVCLGLRLLAVDGGSFSIHVLNLVDLLCHGEKGDVGYYRR